MKQIKPYLFIIAFLVLPLLLVPIIRKANQKFNYESPVEEKINTAKYGLVVHGGAGNLTKDNLPDSIAKIYQSKLDNALSYGYELIKIDSSANFVVCEVIKILEDSPLFNAGKGSVLTADGKVEMDASIMDGRTMEAGAVCGVQYIKNPITAAYSVLEHSEHVLLSTKGAERFAKEKGLKFESSNYFITPKQLRKHKTNTPPSKHGTVGCVVLDKKGNLAAGTSTGGMMNKKYGRVGDSPIIGAGTYANNASCGVSCTGHGEFFMRLCIAYQVSSRMLLLHESLSSATQNTINELSNAKGTGGMIAMDKNGNYSFTFNTKGMFRGVYLSTGDRKTEIFTKQTKGTQNN